MLLTKFLEYVHNGIINNNKKNIEIYKKKLEKTIGNHFGGERIVFNIHSLWSNLQKKSFILKLTFVY